jgi:ribosome-interacting GTPase 1
VQTGGPGEGFEVQKYGDGRVALIGFPSVGKSTLLSQLTGTESEAAAYEFTTLTCIPGIIHYKGTKIQLLDLPGIIEGAAQGKGRGRQVCSSASLFGAPDNLMQLNVCHSSMFQLQGHLHGIFLIFFSEDTSTCSCILQTQELVTGSYNSHALVQPTRAEVKHSQQVWLSSSSKRTCDVQVIAVCKSADLLLMVLDAVKPHSHRDILTRELESVGIRLNREPPQIYLKKKKTGGLSFNSTLPLTKLDEKLVQRVLQEYKVHNADVLIKEDASVDDLIDVLEVCCG